MSNKTFKTHNQQLKVLRNRGLGVAKNGSPKRILEKENYYNIINGYKDLFIAAPKTATTKEQYITGSNISEIHALYQFDNEMKMIVLKRILRVENNIKAAIAYSFSEKYGNENYLIIANFGVIPRDAEQMKNIMNLIKGIQGNIAQQVSRRGAIKHYMLEYGYVPLWVLVNILTLGTVSKFYSLMKQSDRQTISKIYGISDSDLEKILGILTLCRNICAHDERLYNFKSHIAIRNNPLHSSLGIPTNGNGPICGKVDLFAIMISLKILLPKSEFKKMALEIRKTISVLAKELAVISSVDILNKMGFPSNWESIISL